MGNTVSLQVCDPSGTFCIGEDVLSITALGLSVSFDISGCTESISVGPDATTFTTVCPGSVTTATLSGVSSGDNMFSATDLNSGVQFNQSQMFTNSKLAESITSPIKCHSSMFMGMPIKEYQRQLDHSLKNTFLTNEPILILIHRVSKPVLRINIARKATILDIKSKLNIPLCTCIHWKGINMENHYPIGYFVTESILNLKLM